MKKLDVTDALLDIIVVKNDSAVSLFNSFKYLFEERNIPITIIIGFGSDNCSTMLSKKMDSKNYSKIFYHQFLY